MVPEELLARDFRRLLISSQKIASAMKKRLSVSQMVRDVALNGITRKDVFQ